MWLTPRDGERAQWKAISHFGGNSAMDAGRSYNFVIFPLPLPLSSKHVLDRGGVGTEKEQNKKKKAQDAQQRTNKRKTAKPISSDHQASGDARNSGVDVPREKEDRTVFIQRVDLSVLGEMVEEARRGYNCPMFMDLALDMFRCYRVCVASCAFCWQTSDGSARSGRD